MIGHELTSDRCGPPAKRRAAIAAALAMVLLALLAAIAAPSPAGAAASDDDVALPSVIEVGGDAVVLPGSVVNQVYAVGGDALVAGVVQADVVCVGGDVQLSPTAVVQENVVCIGGRVIRQEGAVVLGDTTVVSPGVLRSLAGWNPIDPLVDPRSGGELLAWALSLVAYVGLAAAVAAAAPRPVAAVRARVDHRPWSSLGVGLLAGLVVVPLISVVLFASVIGIPLLVPWLLVVVPVALIVAFVAVSATLGRLTFAVARRDAPGLVVAAATGALLLCLARVVPYAGAAVWLLGWTLGFGAVSLALVAWLREGRLRRRSRAGSTKNST